MSKTLANITYHGGKSYRMVLPGRPVVRFYQNRTIPVSDPKVIERCKNTSGFSVQEVPLKKKVLKPVDESTKKVAEATVETSEDKPKKKTKKKGSKKKSKKQTYSY
jgi:hypothetical protein